MRVTYTQSSVLRNANLRNHWWGGARKRINQQGSEPGNAIILNKKQTGGWMPFPCFLKSSFGCMCTHAAATSNCRLQQLNISLPTAASTAGVTIDITIATTTASTTTGVTTLRSLTPLPLPPSVSSDGRRQSSSLPLSPLSLFSPSSLTSLLSVRPSPLLP
jgi:hypothetical protein